MDAMPNSDAELLASIQRHVLATQNIKLALNALSSSWVATELPPDQEQRDFDRLLALLKAHEEQIQILHTKLFQLQQLQDHFKWVFEQEKIAARNLLLDRQCQLEAHRWRCRRRIQSVDEAETYCPIHRTVKARESARKQHSHRIDEPIQYVPKKPKKPKKSELRQRKPDPITREDDVQILTDRVVEVDSLPPESDRVLLSSQLELRANQLVSWNYAVAGRRHSRRYEGYTRDASHIYSISR